MRSTITNPFHAKMTVYAATFRRSTARILGGVFYVWSGLLVALDQATKLWAQARFARHGDELPLALGFSFTYTENTGASFGMLRDFDVPVGPFVLDGTLVLGLLSLAVSVALVIYLARRGGRLDGVTYAALTVVLAGALGNMIDRLRLGYVIDFIHFEVGAFDFPVFNLADCCVVIGAALLLLHGFGPGERRPQSRDATEPRTSMADRDGAEPGWDEAERP